MQQFEWVHAAWLGLAIVQKVIVSHNGRITAGNHPDGGAVFTLELPLAPTP